MLLIEDDEDIRAATPECLEAEGFAAIGAESVRARAAVLPVVAGGFVLGAVTRGEVERAERRLLPADGNT